MSAAELLKQALPAPPSAESVVSMPPVGKQKRFLWRMGFSVVFLVSYVALDRSTVALQMWSGVSAWYPPSALSLAVLFGIGIEWTPLVLLTAFLSSNLNYHTGILSYGFLFASPLIVGGYSAAAWFLRYRLHVNPKLLRLRDLCWYLAVAVIAALVVGAGYVACLVADHRITWSDYDRAVFNFWAGDSVALICLTPFLLVHVISRLRPKLYPNAELGILGGSLIRRPQRNILLGRLEGLGQGASIVLTLWIVFWWRVTEQYALFYLCFVPIIWIAVRRGFRAVTTGTLAFHVGAIYALLLHGLDLRGLAIWQVLMIVLSLTCLFLGAVTSERKQSEEALRESEEKFSKAFRFAPDLITFSTLTEGRFIEVNDTYLRMMGYTREETVGRPSSELEIWADPRERERLTAAVMREGRVLEQEIHLRKKGGDTLTVRVSAELIELGHTPCMLAVARDVTERMLVERELQNAKEQAEAASRAKSDFLSNMSHEIRTPMNGIMGMTELALDTPLTPDQREYLTLVKSSADSLLILLNDILDFSKIEAGKLDFDPIAFAMRESLAEWIKALSYRAHEKGLELVCRVAPEVPLLVVGDPGRLRQVLVNLVGNAIKFTSQGDVTVQVKRDAADETDGEVTLHFTVRDSGIGIPEEKQKRIFEAFTQVDASTTRRFGGTGLGLAIAGRLVGMMKGRIWVESEVGRGSTFHFTARMGSLQVPVNEDVLRAQAFQPQFPDLETQPREREARR